MREYLNEVRFPWKKYYSPAKIPTVLLHWSCLSRKSDRKINAPSAVNMELFRIRISIPRVLERNPHHWRKMICLLGQLPKLAYELIREIYQAVLGRDDVVPGMVADVQTFGELSHWKYFACGKIYLFFQLLKKFQRQYPLFQLCFHFLSRLPMICSDFSDSSIRIAREKPISFNI